MPSWLTDSHTIIGMLLLHQGITYKDLYTNRESIQYYKELQRSYLSNLKNFYKQKICENSITKILCKDNTTTSHITIIKKKLS